MATLGQRIKELREEKGYTQEQFAIALGIDVSKSAIGMYELDKREPDKEKLEAIADFFNVDLDYLFGKSSFRNKQEWLSSQQTPSLSSLQKNEKLLISDFRSLNPIGQDKAVEYVSDLADNPKYKKAEEIEQVKEEEEPYVPKVMAAHHPTYNYSEEDFQDIDNILKIVAQKKREKGEL